MSKFSKQPRSVQIAIIVGLALIALGAVRLFGLLFGFSGFRFVVDWFRSIVVYLWPTALIVAGIYLVWAGKNGKLKGFQQVNWNKPFGKSFTDKRIAGVCGGIASFFGVDSTIIRVLVVVLFVVSPWFTVIAYILAAIFLPRL